METQRISKTKLNVRKSPEKRPTLKYTLPLALIVMVIMLGSLMSKSSSQEMSLRTQEMTLASEQTNSEKLPDGVVVGIPQKSGPTRPETTSQTPGSLATSDLSKHEAASLVPEVPPENETFLPIISKSPPIWARTYYVDSYTGKDSYSCIEAQDPSKPKKSVTGVMSCNPGAGQIVRFRGEFKETIFPKSSGSILYQVQDIAQVEGSVVTFNQAITGIYTPTDIVTIYGSRKGNSGAFSIISVKGNQVSVDTSFLPGGQFLPEVASDPGMLQAAILRPVHFTAWEKDNPPVWTGLYQAYHAINQRVIMVSYLKSIAGDNINPGYIVWPAFEIDGKDSGNSDFQIFDHLEVSNASCAIAIESNIFQSNYNIIQFNYLHDIGWGGNTHGDAFMYYGFAYHPELHHDYAQIMYNKIGPHKDDPTAPYPMKGPGIEIKHSAHNATVFGNEIFGIDCSGCDNAPIKVSAPNAFIANNFVHDVDPPVAMGCGISIVNDLTPYNSKLGGYGTIIVNNIIANVRRVGIWVVDTSNVQILNNTIFDIFPEPDCDAACMEESMGIEIWNYQGPTYNIVIKNNIVQSTHIGIGRYIWSSEKPYSIDSDYNLVFDTDYPFRGSITQNTHDLILDPRLIDPHNQNFALMTSSPAGDSGIPLTNVFSIDNHDAAAPTLPLIIPPIIRTGEWNRGAYED